MIKNKKTNLITEVKTEHLSKDILKEFVISGNANTDDLTRPSSNLSELMRWVKKSFENHLKDKINLNIFTHNTIMINGQFVEFAKSNNISVESLYKDSIISWRGDNDDEKYLMQGVFLIRADDLEFLQISLYHKSTNFEDDIAFFTIVSEKNYENYIKLKNKFEDWAQNIDRNNHQIRVIGAEDVSYDTDNSWNDLFLPNPLKNEIKSMVEGFLSSKDFYVKKKIPWKRGAIFWGVQGCGKTSIIKTIASCYNFKPVTIAAGSTDEEVRDAFYYAESQSPSLLFFEDLDVLLQNTVNVSSFLNLMDGVSTREGILVIATTNNIKAFPPSITDRPSRFDRKFEIPLPTQEMSLAYTKKWFENLLSVKEYKEIGKIATKHNFSYCDIKELYISSMYEALARNSEIQNKSDIYITLNRIIKDKGILKGKNINTNKYFE